MLRVLKVLLFLVAPLTAFADIEYHGGSIQHYYFPGDYYGARDACNAALQQIPLYQSGDQCNAVTSGKRWEYSKGHDPDGDGTYYYYTSWYHYDPELTCPAGTTLNSTTGECEPEQTCYDRRGDEYGAFRGESLSDMCIDGCTVTASGVAIYTSEYDPDDPESGWLGNYYYSGGECENLPEGEVETKAPAPCPDGYTKNTSDVCMPDPGTTVQEGETVCDITKSGDCLTFDVGSTIPPYYDPEPDDFEPSTEGEETGAGGEVIHSGGGASASAYTSDLNGDGQTGGCDPVNDPNCIQTNSGTVEGGLSCDVPPKCDGDAIMCANLTQAFKLRCSSDEGMKKTLSGIESEIAGDIRFASPWASGETFDINADGGSIFGNGGYLTAQCPQPIQINTVLAGTISFSLDWICQLAEFLKPVVMLIASVLALRIVGRAF